MILQIFITPQDLADFFKKSGFETKVIAVPDFVPAYHGSLIETEKDVLHVVSGEKVLPAHETFIHVIRQRLATPDKITKALVKQILNDN